MSWVVCSAAPILVSWLDVWDANPAVEHKMLSPMREEESNGPLERLLSKIWARQLEVFLFNKKVDTKPTKHRYILQTPKEICYFCFFFPSVPMEILKIWIQKCDCRQLGDHKEPPTGWQHTGPETQTALAHNPPTVHPEVPWHPLYTVGTHLALLAHLCGSFSLWRNTKVQTLISI